MTVVEDSLGLRTSRNRVSPVLGFINGVNNFAATADYPSDVEKTLDFTDKFYYVVAGSTASEFTDLERSLTATQPVHQSRVTGPVRLIQSVARAWSLDNDELASLLAYPSPLFVEELLGGRLTFGDNEDRADRARLIYLIHDTLSDLFVNPQDEQRWIRSPLQALGNAVPLDYMVENRIPGMVAVRQFVEQRLANR